MICQATFIVSPSTAVNIDVVLLRVVQDLAVVRERHPVLAVAEHVAGLRIFLDPQAVHRRLVRQLDDLVALHHVEADAADAGVRLVVGEQVAPVIGAVREGRMRMVQVAVRVDAAPVLQELAVFAASGPRSGSCRLSLVWPQPVALSRLNTGMRISSRIEGRPMMRTSPVWPLEKNT